MATKSPTAKDQLGALAHDTRLGIFKLLMKHMPDGLPAGELSDQLDVSPSNLSAHLTMLTQSGLINMRASGRYRIYTVDLDETGRMIDFLVSDCCHAHPQICSQIGMTVKSC